MFPGGGYSESMPNDEVDEAWWCDYCGMSHYGVRPSDCEKYGCPECNRIRQGSDGITYSYAMIGVLCPSCEHEASGE